MARGREGYGSKTYQMTLRFTESLMYTYIDVVSIVFTVIADSDAFAVCLSGQSDAT